MSSDLTEEPRIPAARAVLGVISVAMVLIALNLTMLSVALPRIVSDLGASAVQGNWILLSYMLVNGAMLVMTGQLADSLNQRSIFVLGTLVFGLAALGQAMAGDPNVFIALRAVQGLGAAMMLSTAGAMIAVIFPPSMLSWAMGVYLSGFAIAQVAGPNVGGVVTTLLGWRYLYILQVPIAIGVVVLARRLLRDLPSSPKPTGRRFDPVGNALIFIGLGSLLYALSRVQRSGWLDGVVIATLAVFAVSVVVFAFVERRVSNPAIDMDMLKTPRFALANFAGAVLNIPRSTTAVLLSLYFQGVLGDDPLEAALKITPLAASVAIGALAVRTVTKGNDDRRQALWYSIGTAFGITLLLVSISAGANLGGMVLAMLVIGFTTGVFAPLNSSSIMAEAPMERAGIVNGTRTMFQVIGSSVGTAISLSVIVGALTAAQAQLFFAGDPAALDPTSLELLDHGYQLAFGIMLALTLAAVVAGVLLARQPPDPALEPSTP